MSEAESNVDLERQYHDLTARFRSQWTFLQYLEAMERTSEMVDRDTGPSVLLGAVRKDLKTTSEILSRTTTPKLRSPQAETRSLLDASAALLLGKDSRVPPAQQRQFFFRVSGYDNPALERLLAFYLLELDRDRWTDDEIDKVDFLATRLVADSAVGDRPPDWQRIETDIRGLIERRTRCLGRVDGDDESSRPHPSEIFSAGDEEVYPDEISELIDRFRGFKHRLGPRMLETAVWLEVLRTNWRIKSAVGSVIRTEESLLLADLERIFAISERVSLPIVLDDQITRLRQRLSTFEQDCQRGNLRLREILGLRQDAKEALGRLEASDSAAAAGVPAEPQEGGPLADPGDQVAAAGAPSRQLRTPLDSAATASSGERRATRPVARQAMPLGPSGLPGAEFFSGEVRRVLAALEQATAAPPDPQALSRLDLDADEVEAFRRLRSAGGTPEAQLTITLEAAAIRIRLEELIARIQRPDADGKAAGARTREVEEAERALAAAGDFLRALQRQAAEAIVIEKPALARAMTAARFRLEARRAELWLLIQTRGRREGG